MQNEIEINFPNSFGNIEFETNHGTFTVAVKDKEKKPLSGLRAKNFHLHHNGEFVHNIEVSEQVVGVYTLWFPIEEKDLNALKLEGRQVKPYEIMLTVKQGDKSSNNRLILLF